MLFLHTLPVSLPGPVWCVKHSGVLFSPSLYLSLFSPKIFSYTKKQNDDKHYPNTDDKRNLRQAQLKIDDKRNLIDEKFSTLFLFSHGKEISNTFLGIYIVYTTVANGTLIFTGVFRKKFHSPRGSHLGVFGYCLELYDFHSYDKILL